MSCLAHSEHSEQLSRPRQRLILSQIYSLSWFGDTNTRATPDPSDIRLRVGPKSVKRSLHLWHTRTWSPVEGTCLADIWLYLLQWRLLARPSHLALWLLPRGWHTWSCSGPHVSGERYISTTLRQCSLTQIYVNTRRVTSAVFHYCPPSLSDFVFMSYSFFMFGCYFLSSFL